MEKFNKVFATENNRHSIRLVKKSIKLNNFSNLETARLSDDETAAALANERPFRRLENIDIQFKIGIKQFLGKFFF